MLDPFHENFNIMLLHETDLTMDFAPILYASLSTSVNCISIVHGGGILENGTISEQNLVILFWQLTKLELSFLNSLKELGIYCDF